MIKYRQLLKSKSKARKNLWYICGDNPALIEDALSIARDHVSTGVSSVCLGVFYGGYDSPQDIQDFIDRPYFEERKLVLIYDPGKISDLHKQIVLSDTSVFYILVSFTYDVPDAFSELLKTNKSRSVNCSLSDDEDLKLLAESRLNITESALNKLVQQSNGDAEWLLNKVRVLEFFDVPEVTTKLIEVVCQDTGVASFEKSIIEFDKRRCFQYINSMGVSEISVGRIVSDLHNLALLNSVSAEFSKQMRPITDKTGLSKKQVDYYAKDISFYDATTSKRCFSLVMKLYEHLRSNDRLAYITLVSGW